MKQEGFDQVFHFLKALEKSDSVILQKAFNYRTNERLEEKMEANEIAKDFKHNQLNNNQKYKPKKSKR